MPHPDPSRQAAPETGAACCGDESSMAWVDAVEETTVGLGTAAGLDTDAAYFLGVAVREAVVNAIRHGTSADGTRRIAVTLRIKPGAVLVVTVRDHGRGFDPSCLPDPLSPENLSRSCGRGIFYIRQFADQVSFTFPPGGGTSVRIEKHLPRSAKAFDPARVGKLPRLAASVRSVRSKATAQRFPA